MSNHNLEYFIDNCPHPDTQEENIIVAGKCMSIFNSFKCLLQSPFVKYKKSKELCKVYKGSQLIDRCWEIQN